MTEGVRLAIGTVALVAIGGSVVSTRRREEWGSPARATPPTAQERVAVQLARSRTALRTIAKNLGGAETFADAMEEELLAEIAVEERRLARTPESAVVRDARRRAIANGPVDGIERMRARLRSGETVAVEPRSRRELGRLRRTLAARRAAWIAAYPDLVADEGFSWTAVSDGDACVVRLFRDGRAVGYVWATPASRSERLRCREDLAALTAQVGALPVWIVHRSHLDETLHGRGLGRGLYERLFAAVAARAGGAAILVPERCAEVGATSKEATRVWASLARRYVSVGAAVSTVPSGSAARRWST